MPLFLIDVNDKRILVEKTLAYLERALSRAGVLVIETMLVSGVNDGVEQLGELAAFLRRLQPAAAYLAIPTRPPAESGMIVFSPVRV